MGPAGVTVAATGKAPACLCKSGFAGAWLSDQQHQVNITSTELATHPLLRHAPIARQQLQPVVVTLWLSVTCILILSCCQILI